MMSHNIDFCLLKFDFNSILKFYIDLGFVFLI